MVARTEELILLHLQGDASDAELAELHALVAKSPALMQEILRRADLDLELESALGSEARHGSGSTAEMAAVKMPARYSGLRTWSARRTRTATILVPAGIAAALAMAVGLLYWTTQRTSQTGVASVLARVAGASDGASILRGADSILAVDGSELRAGDLVKSQQSKLMFAYSDGTRVALEPNSSATLNAGKNAAKHVALAVGILHASVAKQPPNAPMLLTTPLAEAAVVGTQLTLRAEAARARLDVTEGTVRFLRMEDRVHVDVTTGFYAVVARNEEFAARSIAPPETPVSSPYTAWKRGPPHAADFFPIGVWMQAPDVAAQYKKAGVNFYLGLWEGPTEAQLNQLKNAGMLAVCERNAVGALHENDATIMAWFGNTEPDNAQQRGRGYGPPLSPAVVQRHYNEILKADATRPVLTQFGEGVAWDGWIGRGERSGHFEDYPEYLKGCDIASFNIYPVTHPSAEVRGKLETIGVGAKRLRQWGSGKKIVWNFVEATRIRSEHKPTPEQIKAEVWLGLVHGSQGIVYYCHVWKPRADPAGLLDDAETLTAITAINRQVRELAPVLNSASIEDAVTVTPTAPVSVMVKRHGGALYVFAVNTSNATARVAFQLRDGTARAKVDVLDETRTLPLIQNSFPDDFAPYGVHLYCIR